MATISNSGITNGGRITAAQITQITDALTGAEAYDVTISGSLNINTAPVTNITASGNISSSGTVTANTYIGLPSGIISGSTQLPSGLISSSLQVFTNITASGNISSSGTVTANTYVGLPSGIISGSTQLPSGLISSSLQVFTSITASGDISASGTISAFGSSSLLGLPPSEPSVAGTLWLSGSGAGSASGSKYLMVFTG